MATSELPVERAMVVCSRRLQPPFHALDTDRDTCASHSTETMSDPTSGLRIPHEIQVDHPHDSLPFAVNCDEQKLPKVRKVTPREARLTRGKPRYYEPPVERATVVCSRRLQPPFHAHNTARYRCRKSPSRPNAGAPGTPGPREYGPGQFKASHYRKTSAAPWWQPANYLSNVPW